MSTNERNFAEKRDFIRMFIDAPVEFTIAGSGSWCSGTGKNLSGGGLSFSCEEELSVDDQVEIKIHPETPVTPSYEAKVRVIRVIPEEDGIYTISAQVEEITS
ncbi:MAG: hypothetical protein DRQ47_09630 [Gammaproteobacteria bacterium]|nr:MAG: hypothetical protein DRQ47_09630 [Gammaproteobacteria bacterium]